MSQKRPPAYRPATPCQYAGAAPGSISGASTRGRVELSALADNLFRLRLTQRAPFSIRPSWAVAKTDWAPVRVRRRHATERLVIQTNAGQLTFALHTGAWELCDQAGNVLFEAAPEATGFTGEQVQTTLRLEPGESLFGLGETTGTFNKRGLIREFWNSDVLGHAPAIHPSLRNLYVSIPLAISLREGRAAGLFWDNPARQIWDLGQTQTDRWQMRAVSGELDLYLFTGPTLPQVVERYAELTGRQPLPPRWALGYHQCRYSYPTRKRFEEVAATFRQKEIPCDALYLDIHHMDEYRVFTFGRDFPEPAPMIAGLAGLGFKVVTIVDPGVKDEPAFGVWQRGVKAKAFVRNPKGKEDYVGKVWPGAARFPDFLRAKVREWWGREQAALSRLGVAGFWNDMNEPANFDGPGKTLPEDCRHRSDSGPLPHALAHNVYGMEMARASREGALTAQSNRRPLVITRAGYAGVQRYALVWTGDNSSVWEHLADSIQMLLNLGMSGVPFCGGDAGGFMDNTTPELLVRWMQFAAFTPFFRNHSNLGTIDQEPWAFGPEVEAICRQFISLRYQLLPYLYGLFVAAYRTGAPIMRPLAWHYPGETDAVAAGDQFLLGQDLLVAPIIRQGATARAVYLPRGDWYNFWTNELVSGGRHIVAEAPLERMPLFVRAGAIIPMGAVQQFVGEKNVDTINLHLWPGGEGRLDWYEDDGQSQDYERGEYCERTIRSESSLDGSRLNFAPTNGARRSDIKTWRIILRAAKQAHQWRLKGQPLAAYFDATTGIGSAQFPNDREPITIELE